MHLLQLELVLPVQDVSEVITDPIELCCPFTSLELSFPGMKVQVEKKSRQLYPIFFNPVKKDPIHTQGGTGHLLLEGTEFAVFTLDFEFKS